RNVTGVQTCALPISNVDAKAEHLLQYAIMGSIYSEKVRQVKKPRIGLLNVGTEDGKGNKLSQKAFALMQEAPLNFIGNVEARDRSEERRVGKECKEW